MVCYTSPLSQLRDFSSDCELTVDNYLAANALYLYVSEKLKEGGLPGKTQDGAGLNRRGNDHLYLEGPLATLVSHNKSLSHPYTISQQQDTTMAFL
jgi:hypothetical protein